MNDLIEKLSNLRSQFNCFDENERDAYHTLSEAIKVLSEQPEPCEDAVSRKDAIIQLSHNKNGDDDCDVIIQHDIETLKQLSPVTPKRKTGKWVRKGEEIVCDKCGYSLYDVLSNIRLSQGSSYVYIPVYYDFCPKCGADMRGEQDGR